MLDDINSELLSIYPGTFPNPRPFSRKPLVFNSGFHAYIRPPLPLYRIQCNNDFIAEKSKKAEAAIRKLYKAAATSSSTTFKEGNTLFQHDLTPEAMLTKYRDTQIYSKSRLRKVNRRQLLKAIALAKKKDDDESKKQYDVSISKIDLHATSSKQKLKQKIFGALKLEPKPWRNKNRASSAAEDDEKTLNSQSETSVPKPSTYPNNENRTKAETEQSKQKGPLTVRRPMMLRKSCELIQKKKAEVSKDSISNSSPECLLKEEDGEGRKTLKVGNYTKIVTFKKKSIFKSATSVEISSFPFNDQLTGRYGGLQKVAVQKEGGGNNEIDHMYKINDLETSMKARSSSARQSNVGFMKKVTHSDSKLDQVARKMEENLETNEHDWSTAKLMERDQFKKDLLCKYGVSQTLTKPPHGLQLKEIQTMGPSKMPIIEEIEMQKYEASPYRQRKPPKREEKYLFLPKVTPTLGVDPPKLGKERKNTMRLRVLPIGTKSEVTFVNFR